MTVVAPPEAPPAPGRRRLWDAPLRAHVAALAVVLLALVPLIGTGSSFSADEGAVIVQARSLAAGHGWIVAHPVPEADPAGANYPLEFSERGPSGSAPYAKHPLYPLLLAGADRVAGTTGMVLLSVLGTVVAAALAGILAGRLDPTLSRPSVWVVGLASPLLFDGYLLIAHALGAALAAAAVLAAVVAIERRSVFAAFAVLPPLAACVLLRSEGLFVAAALAVVAGVLGLWRRELRLPAMVIAAGAVAAGAGAHLLDRWWAVRLLGGSGVPTVGVTGTTGGAGLVSGRVHGFVLTWLTPSYGGQTATGIALLVMLAALAAGAASVRWHPNNGRRIAMFGGVAAAAAVLALIAGPTTVVPGLLLAFPLVAAALVVSGRRTLRTDAARVAAGVSVLFALAVVATQYAKGGGGEWGGRYFALAVPLYVPVLLLALWDQRDRIDRAVARRAVAALVVCSAALSVLGIGALVSTHRATARLVAAVDRAGRTVAPDHPVVVSTEGSMPRFAWSTFDQQRWLLSAPAGLDDLLARLSGAGVERVGFVTRDIARDRPLLDAAGVHVVSTDGSQSGRRWQILVVELR